MNDELQRQLDLASCGARYVLQGDPEIEDFRYLANAVLALCAAIEKIKEDLERK